MGFLSGFFMELKAYWIVRREYRRHKKAFESVGLKMDWFGRLWRVINRDPDVAELGSDADKVYLQNDLAQITQVLVEYNIVDILGVEIFPLEEVTQIDSKTEVFENANLLILTPMWRSDRQYVTKSSVFWVSLLFAMIIAAVVVPLVLFL